MSALTPDQKERARAARSRAGHIRYGMQIIGDTYVYIAQARAQGDHLTLGYESWDAYVVGEFGEHRVKLPPEKRAAAVAALAAVGLSQREIGRAIGVSASTVNRELGGPSVSNETDESGVHVDRPADSPLVDAMKTAIDDATERAHELRDRPPGADASPASEAGVDELSEASTPAPNHRTDASGEEPIGSSADQVPEVTDDASSFPVTAEEVGSAPASSAPQEQERTGEVRCPTCGLVINRPERIP